MNILTKQTLDKGNTPKDILMIRRLIENEGIEEYEKNTLNFIAEFLNTYTLDILSESKQFANLSDRAKINIEDVKLAVKFRQQNMYSKKPDIASLNQMARETNSVALPHIPENPHILLPPPEHSLIRNNFQVFSEDLANMLNNPNFDQEDKNRLEDLDLYSTQNRGKSRQSIIGIKRHTERNTERLSITSNFKKRKTDLAEGNNENAFSKNKNFNSLNADYSNKINTDNINTANNNANNNNFNITSGGNAKIKQVNNNINFNSADSDNKGIGGGNRKRLHSENNFNEDEDNKSENQEFGDNDYNNEEGDAEDYDQMDNQSENSEGNFGLRDDFNHSDMGDYL